MMSKDVFCICFMAILLIGIVITAIISIVVKIKERMDEWEGIYSTNSEIPLMPIDLDTFDTWYQINPNRYCIYWNANHAHVDALTTPSAGYNIEFKFTYRDYRRFIRQVRHGKYYKLKSEYNSRLRINMSSEEIQKFLETVYEDVDNYGIRGE